MTVSGDVITIGDGVTVFVLEETDGSWTLQEEKSNQYLYATTTKKLAYADDAKTWTLADGTDGVIMTYGDYGTMLYNVSSPRFTTYTSSPNASMIQANLYVETSEGGKTLDPLIVADEEISFSTTVGKPQTKQLNVLSEGLTADITLTLSGDQAFTLKSNTIAASQDDASVDVTFNPTAAGSYSATVTLSSAGAELVTVSLVGEATDATQPVADVNSYELVTDAATLADGDQVIIAYIEGSSTKQALSTTQNGNNRAATSDLTLNADGTITPGSAVQLITLEQDGGNFLLNVGNGYLYAASSSKNYLRTETTADDNAKASITIANGSATIVFQGNYERNTLRYNPNNGTPIFSCYASNTSVNTLPQLYRKVAPEAVSVTIGTTGYATLYYSDKNLVVPEGVEASAYYVSDGTLTAQSVGSVIPAGTAVVLSDTKADGQMAHTYDFAVTADAGTAAPDISNHLHGSDEAALTSVADGGTYKYYMLSLNADSDPASVGFYYGAADGAAFTCQAHKAFLAVPAAEGAAVRGYLLNGSTIGDELTTVRPADFTTAADGVMECFDLSGRRIQSSTQLPKGIYIVNGRKVVVR